MEIHKTWWLPFPVSRVYRAWTSSDTVVPPAVRMRVDPREGGVYQLFTGLGEVPDVSGLFRTVERNRRLAYSWQWKGEDVVTEVAVEFAAEGSGTLLQLSHRGFLDDAATQAHDHGWDSYVAGVQALLRRTASG